MKRQAWKRMQAWLLVVAMLVSVVTGIGTTKTAKAATKMGVTYTVHVQTYGDQQGWVHDGTMAGTKGQAKRLEEIRVKLTGDEYSGSIQYKISRAMAGRIGHTMERKAAAVDRQNVWKALRFSLPVKWQNITMLYIVCIVRPMAGWTG